MREGTVSDSDLIALAQSAPDASFGTGTASIIRDIAGELLIQRQLERAIRSAAYAAGNDVDTILADLKRWRGER